jgi:hypothetical protein
MDATFIDDFRRTVNNAVDRLLAFSDADASHRRAAGKWCMKEIIGHLIDSAANNHARFVRAQLQGDLVFDGYDQARWVEVQRYRDRSWTDLVRLWQAYNLHVASVMETADADLVGRPRAQHNLDELAFQRASRGEPATLDYFMRDYVAHLKHHLQQALPHDGSERRTL